MLAGKLCRQERMNSLSVCIFLAFHDFLKHFGNILVQLLTVAGAPLCLKKH